MPRQASWFMAFHPSAIRYAIPLLCFLLFSGAALAGDATFTFLRRVPAAELTRMLNEERSTFIAEQAAGDGYQLPSPSTAGNDVDLYTVRYVSHVPEQGNRRIAATGLLALPVVTDMSRLPLISYQHGTVFGRYEVPSYAFRATNPSDYPHYDGSYETRYMVGLFAGNGYALIAADYFGLGDAGTGEHEAFVVKESTQRGCEDLYRDAVQFLKDKGIEQDGLFLAGWSQGGLNTTGLQEKMEAEGIPITAAFTASAPSDPFATLSGLIFYPRKGDAQWLNAIMAFTLFSFQNYFGPRDLAERTLDPAVYASMKAMYERSYKGQEGLASLMKELEGKSLEDYLRPELRTPVSFAASEYGKQLMLSETYRQGFKSPLRMFYGSNDEVIKEMVGQLPAIYQAVLIGNLSDQSASTVSAEEVKGATHRLSFISAAPIAKSWMDGLRGTASPD